MIQAIKKLFQKKAKKKPLFKEGDTIRLSHITAARKVYTNLECSLDKNMILLFRGETEEHFFFVVRTNFYAVYDRHNYANDRDNIFISKELLKAAKYKKL
jgi:hypothetical protein